MERVEELSLPSAQVWSTTALKTIGTCGRQFFLRYRQPQVQSIPTPPLVFGSAVHKVLERLHKEGDIWEERLWQRVWIDEWYTYASQCEWGNYRKGIYDKLGAVMIADYITKNRDAEVLETEFAFQFEINGFPVRGIIDQIRKTKTGAIQIIDFKTSKDEPDRLLLRADPQFTIYQSFGMHWAAERKIKKPVTVSWYHLKTGKLIPTARRAEDIEIVTDMLREGKTRVDQEMFTRNIGHHCNYCTFKEPCLAPLGDKDV